MHKNMFGILNKEKNIHPVSSHGMNTSINSILKKIILKINTYIKFCKYKKYIMQ